MGGFGGALQLSVLTMAVADSLTALPVLSVPMPQEAMELWHFFSSLA